MALTEEMVLRAQRQDDDRWHVGNQVLYNLCRDYPEHVDDATIVAKVWLIGRAYSASIERGRPKGLSNDRFYTEAVPNEMRKQKHRLDDNLKALAELKEVDDESSIAKMLETHGHLVRCFKKLTTLSKRSLASKYLHFHLPNLFFIYDSRAASSIRSLPGGRHTVPSPPTADPEYAKFVGAALGVREHVSSEFGERLSPRQLDRLLLATFASAAVPLTQPPR